ncbi:cytochrome P450, partial [Conidiobolus coronatus NRRL 28638]
LSRKETIREVLVIIIGGMDTTAITCSWAFWLILSNPEVYKKAQEEVDKVFPDKNIPIDVTTCKTKMPIIEAILLETMRLYPVSAMPLIRNPPATGTTLSGYEIPPNTNVFMTNYAYHRNPELWENPDKFDYTRWLIDDNTQLKSQLMVFSQGPRGCPG